MNDEASPSPRPSVEISGLHPFVQEHSAESPYCGALVLRDGAGDTCGRLRIDPVHTREPTSDPDPSPSPMIFRGKQPPLPKPPPLIGSVPVNNHPQDTGPNPSSLQLSQQVVDPVPSPPESSTPTPEQRLQALVDDLRASLHQESVRADQAENELGEVTGTLERYKKMHENQLRTIQQLTESNPPSDSRSGSSSGSSQVSGPTQRIVVDGNERVIVTVEVIGEKRYEGI